MKIYTLIFFRNLISIDVLIYGMKLMEANSSICSIYKTVNIVRKSERETEKIDDTEYLM